MWLREAFNSVPYIRQGAGCVSVNNLFSLYLNLKRIASIFYDRWNGADSEDHVSYRRKEIITFTK